MSAPVSTVVPVCAAEESWLRGQAAGAEREREGAPHSHGGGGGGGGGGDDGGGEGEKEEGRWRRREGGWTGRLEATTIERMYVNLH